MTPYELKLLIDIYCGPDWKDGRNEPILHDTLKAFARDGLIDTWDFPAITGRGECFIQSLQATPLPTRVWRGANGVEYEA